MAVAGTIRIEFTLPAGVEFVSLHAKHDGGFAVCLKAAFDVHDSRGSSLGSTYGSGESSTIESACNNALQRLYQRLREQADRPAKAQPTLTRTKTEGVHSKSLSADDIFAAITKKES